MTTKDFMDLVCKMRSAQKKYFRTRYFEDLEESKKLEREVDQALRNFSIYDFHFSLFPDSSSS